MLAVQRTITAEHFPIWLVDKDKEKAETEKRKKREKLSWFDKQMVDITFAEAGVDIEDKKSNKGNKNDGEEI